MTRYSVGHAPHDAFGDLPSADTVWPEINARVLCNIDHVMQSMTYGLLCLRHTDSKLSVPPA